MIASKGRSPMKVLAVSSGGGHWVELLRIRPALEGHTLHFVTVQPDYRDDVPRAGFSTVRDATRWNPFGILLLAAQVFLIVARIRPDIVISTGAAPGYFAVRFGKIFGARTIWVDTLADVSGLSMSGKMAGEHADLWLTQWPEVAQPDGPEYAGQVI
jgi:UDP-N-acetylglucosamine:LPS N-acetylglucosamine transferase